MEREILGMQVNGDDDVAEASTSQGRPSQLRQVDSLNNNSFFLFFSLYFSNLKKKLFPRLVGG